MRKIILAGLAIVAGLLLLAGTSYAAEGTFGQNQSVNLVQWNVPHYPGLIPGAKTLPDVGPMPGMETLPDIPGDHVRDWREHMVPLYKGTE